LHWLETDFDFGKFYQTRQYGMHKSGP